MVWTAPQEKGSFISEGDTPTFLNLLDNGLRAFESGYWGGWGGIRRPANAPAAGRGGPAVMPASPDDAGAAPGLAPAGSIANVPKPVEAANGQSPNPGGGRGGALTGGRGGPQISPQTAAVNARFFAAAQNDFAARLKWSVTSKFSDANHAPKVSIKGPLEVAARPGGTVRLEAEVSDPDRDAVKPLWWQYNAAGTYPGDVVFSGAGGLSTSFRVPEDARTGQTIHVILEATDNGAPPLTRYQRVIVRVQ